MPDTKKSKYNYVGWVLFYSLLQPENLGWAQKT